ncbi:MAG: hypothetical protein D6738_05045 [Acidobacteria bacterium]|nr:MAG: hypothetical protein D6738_05045 [Acidobacteriota bacterium]
MPFIRTIPDDEAQGLLRRIYDQARGRAGRVAGIVRVQSLEPHVLDAGIRLYQATTLSPRSPLRRWFRELIAVGVSRANACEF